MIDNQLDNMKVNIKNYLEVTSSTFIGLCSNYMCDINSKLDAFLVGRQVVCIRYTQHHIVIISLIIQITTHIVLKQVNI